MIVTSVVYKIVNCLLFLLQLYVYVEDINNHRPMSSKPVFWASVLENSPKGSVVTTVDASDRDPGSNITFQITSGNPQSLFTINNRTGEFYTH